MKRTVKKKKVTLFHRIEPLLYLAPAFLVLGVFVYYPFFKTIGESFFLLNSMGQIREFIGIENYDESIWYFIAPLITIVCLQKLVAFIDLRFPKIRDKIDGKEKMIIYKGVIQLKAMNEEKYNMNDLYTQLRSKDIRSIEEVEYAILETNGNLSVFTYEENQDNTFPLPLIVSGQIDAEALKLTGKNKKWLKNELKKQGIKSEKEVYGATLSNNSLKIVKFKNQKVENKNEK